MHGLFGNNFRENFIRECGVVEFDRSYWKLRAVMIANGTFQPLSQMNTERLEELRGKFALKANIAKKAVSGFVFITVWQMDCDCASWTALHKVPATFEEVNGFLQRIYDDAEGPVRWHFATAEDASEFKSERRDHALEAFEDGHAHVVYV